MPDSSTDPDDPRGRLDIALANRQSAYPVDEDLLLRAVRCILLDSPFRRAAVSVAVVDDATIHELNVRYLDLDWPTDVLSFVLEREGSRLDGEVILSAETAAAAAPQYGWSAAEELLLYVIHGTLHLVGYDDQTDDEAHQMRAAEDHYLLRLGVQPADHATDPLPVGEGRGATGDSPWRGEGALTRARSPKTVCPRSYHEKGGRSTS